MEVVLALIIGVFTVLYFIYRSTKIPEGLPPGPWPVLPILGHALLLPGEKFSEQMELRKKYGDMVTLYIGPFPTIYLYTADLIREAFSNSAITGRPDMLVMTEGPGGKRGLAAGEGKHWAEQTAFAVRYLRQAGFGRSSQEFESSIHREIVKCFSILKKETGKPIIIGDYLKVILVNVIWGLATGESLSQNDLKLRKYIEALGRGFESSLAGNVSIFFPRLAKWFPNLTGYCEFQNAVRDAHPFYEERIAYYKNTYKEGQVRNIIDAYIAEMRKCTDPSSSFYGEEGEKSLVALLNDLFIGGFQTTGLTLVWMVLFLVKYPEIQEKMFQEVKETVGLQNLPTLADRSNLPYTEAVIAETLRWSSVIPQGIMKTAVKDIEFRGYKIPKGTGFNSFLRAIHHDPEIWGDPDNFRPERFIDERGQFIKHDSFLPFSYGKRPCFGERTAKDELLLVTSSLIQRFEIHVNPDEPNPSLQPTFLLLTAPLPFKVVVYERRKSQSAINHLDHKSKELP